MGQDSWQAEQRKPYFRAKAGKAFAGWLQASITDKTTSPSEPKQETSRRRERLETCMSGLLDKDQIKICFFENELPQKADACRKMAQMRTPRIFAGRIKIHKGSTTLPRGILLRPEVEVQENLQIFYKVTLNVPFYASLGSRNAAQLTGLGPEYETDSLKSKGLEGKSANGVAKTIAYLAPRE